MKSDKFAVLYSTGETAPGEEVGNAVSLREPLAGTPFPVTYKLTFHILVFILVSAVENKTANLKNSMEWILWLVLKAVLMLH